MGFYRVHALNLPSRITYILFSFMCHRHDNEKYCRKTKAMALSKTSNGSDESSTSSMGCIQQQQSSIFNCHFCRKKMVQTEVYRCGSCLSDLQENETGVFCETCILIHIRKGCEVFDCKGYTPQICGVHQNLCLMYCSDCETIFCFNCIGPHCQHRFMAASEKAAEVRKDLQILRKF